MQTCPREAARAGTPRICERIGVRVLSAPAASCSHCLQRAAARRAGALLPSASLHSKHIGGQSSVHADCLRKRWGAAYPASVTPQAGERSAHLAALGCAILSLQLCWKLQSRKCQLSVTSSFCETTTFQPRSRQAEVGVGRLGRRLAPRAFLGSGHATHHGQALVALSRVTCSVSRTQKRARHHDWFTATRLARAPTDSGLPVDSSRLPQ